ncbi:hypothetical protein [Microbacterium sp. SLBN-154]|uniref:hypothetical protein n=1 Tax=Microbacterium sp. SLBN-154 TaxID=2768458 RepID=UPI001F48D9BC|nr:hypothetical protein [Microbacterium sp. SLBN-154]
MRAIVQTETTTRDDVRGEVHRLRAQLERVQGRRMDAPVLPVLEPLAEVLPGGGLRTGSAYSLTRSASLLAALLAGPSQDGTWCAVVGMPDFGVEAAESAGVDLSHLVLVPDPGPRWLAVAATLAEVIPVVAVRPAARAADAEVSRLGARLRDRAAVLLVQGPWPQAEASLDLADPEWSGVGRGHGYLAAREVTIDVRSRRWPMPRRARMSLPAADGGVGAVRSAASAVPALPRLEAVG